MSKPELGAFSVSIPVSDLNLSIDFYERLGFDVTHRGEGYVIMVSGITVIGLFKDMFQDIILTFNPGLRAKHGSGENLLESWRLDEFMDVREIQAQLQDRGLEEAIVAELDEEENPSGPGSIILEDPDGNLIQIDQFFDQPKASAK